MSEIHHPLAEHDDEEEFHQQSDAQAAPAGAMHETAHAPTRVTALSAAPVSYFELLVGALALAAWFVLFGGAILIGTESYRRNFENLESAQQLLKSSLIVLAFWTITNVGILCCLSAFLGALGRRTRFAVRLGTPTHRVDVVPPPVSLYYFSAVIRGFSIYGIVMAGLLVLATESFIAPTQGEYVRLAATMSVMSFYAGYDPSALANLLHRVRKLFEGPADEEHGNH